MIFNRFHTSLLHARLSQHFYGLITKEFSRTVDSDGRMLGTKARPGLPLVPRPATVVSWGYGPRAVRYGSQPSTCPNALIARVRAGMVHAP